MKPAYQTTFGDGSAGGEPGNCVSACVASLLELDTADVPNFIVHLDWFRRMQSWLNERGYGVVMVDWPPVVYAGQFPKMPVIVSGWGPRGLRHSCVGRIEWDEECHPNVQVLHDPHPEGGGLDWPRGNVSVEIVFKL